MENCVSTYGLAKTTSVANLRSLVNQVTHMHTLQYHMVQNFDGENTDELMNFQQFVNIFPIKIFHLATYR